MAIRVSGVAELDRLSHVLTGPDLYLNWSSLKSYLVAAATAPARLTPFVRDVDVLWEAMSPGTPTPYCQERRFEVTYTGPVRSSGGFASQGYCYLVPEWAAALRVHHRQSIVVDVYPGGPRDLFVVRS